MIPKIRKAIAGAFATTLGALGTALLDGNLTQAETLASVGAGLVAGYAVWQIKNRRA